MQKLQILFPNPLMRRMREIAIQEDLPVSEIVRRATENWLSRFSSAPPQKSPPQVPLIRGGKCLVKAEKMREQIYE